jgi:REP element-mobilizing transposase RayT
MGRRLRFVPERGTLVEVTCRTVQGRFLLRPSPLLNEIILGILARAQRMYPVGICAFSFVSNHYHLLLRVDDAQQLSKFMAYVNGNLAREAGRLHRWKDKFWARRYQGIVVSQEEAAQVERLKYVLAHGCKEGLVERLVDWPGAHCVRPLLGETLVEGTWFSRTQEYAARCRGEDFHARQYATPESFVLEPLPCWSHLSVEKQRSLAAELVEHIEAEAAAERERTGLPALGPAAILAQHPHDSPARPKKSPAPRIHAASRAARHEFYEAYGLFVAAFREAAERLRAGDLGARFPPGSFPPALAFVPG